MPRIKVSPWLPVVLCAFYRLAPRGSFLPFLAAAAAHELGHILAVYLCAGKVCSLRLSVHGAVLETTPLSYHQEMLCALAGPAVGLLLACTLRRWPWLAFWGLIQGLYNLLPVYPLDGGRALRAALLQHLPLNAAAAVSRGVGVVFGAALAVLGVYATCVLHFGLWTALAAGLAAWRVLNSIQAEKI